MQEVRSTILAQTADATEQATNFVNYRGTPKTSLEAVSVNLAHSDMTNTVRNNLLGVSMDTLLYLDNIPNSQVSFMCTFNALSIDGFDEFLDFIIELRAKYQRPGRFINLDLPHLTGPEHFCVKILPEEYEEKIERLINKMQNKASPVASTQNQSILSKKLHDL